MTKFSESALLVSLNVRTFSARREDKRISAEVADTHNTSRDAGKYNKQLVSKIFLDPISKAATALRDFHYTNTMPWLDEGVRVLAAVNQQHYRTEMTKLGDVFDSAVAQFCRIYQTEVIPDARDRLNGMFNYADYPADVRARFGFGLRFLPIPDSDDFRVRVSDLERETLRAEIEETLSEASRAAMRDVWQRVADSVQAMAAKLSAYKTVIIDGKPKAENVFRDSLVENLRSLCELLPRLNFANDPNLESVRQRIIAELLQTDAPTLRERDSLREQVADKAAAIAASLNEFMA